MIVCIISVWFRFIFLFKMAWSEAWYPDDGQIHAKTIDNKLKNSDSGTQNMVHNTTDFLAKFDWEEKNSSLVSDCIKEIQADTQLQTWFENLLTSGISDDFINKIKQELEENRKSGLDEETLKFLLTSLIAETIEWWFKIGSSTYIEISKQTNQNEATAENDEATAESKESIDKDIVQRVKEMGNICMNYREGLLIWHDDVKEKTEKKAEIAQQQLPEETKNKLKEKGYDDKFINDYILLRVTLNEVRNDSSFDKNAVDQFEGKVNELSKLDVFLKNIDNACNIADTNLSSFSSENISQTRTELFHSEVWNDSLIQAKKSNMESRNYSEMLPEMWNEEMFKKYGQFLQWDLKRCWDEYKANYLWFVEKINSINAKKSRWEDLVPEDQSFLSLEWAIKWIKEQIDNKTKDMVEELCIISQIKWMYMCMWEWDSFDLNKSRWIRYDKEWAMILDGYVDWVAFSIRQDINNPEARLQTSQKIAKLNNGDVFSVWWKDNFVDSNFILPSQNEIFQVIAETVQSDESLSDFDNQSDYITNLQTNIMWKMEKKYENTKYVHHYMEWQVKWEKIADKTLWLIGKINPSIINDTTLMKNISPESNKDLYNFMKILKFNIDNSTNTEKNNLNQCITKILEITNYYADSNGVEDYVTLKYPPIIDNYLKNKAWLNWWDGNSRLNLLSNLFGYYSKKSEDTREWTEKWSTSKVMINDLYRDLFESNNWNNKSQTAVKRETEQKLNSYRKEAEDQSKKADQWLRLDDDNIWKR